MAKSGYREVRPINLKTRIKIMSDKSAIRPEDILPDGVDAATLNGSTVRKGTVAAFLANIEIIENCSNNETVKQAALNMLKELAPAVLKIGLDKHVIFKNKIVQQILTGTEKA